MGHLLGHLYLVSDFPLTLEVVIRCQKEKGSANQKLHMRRPTNQMAALLVHQNHLVDTVLGH